MKENKFYFIHETWTKIFVNYLGQIRLYSLIDLILLLVAARAGMYDIVGVLCLHLGFVAYLENSHARSYREIVPSWVWITLALVGVLFYSHMEFFSFLLFSFLYVNKNNAKWGYFSPFFRGLQNFFLIAGIVGYRSYLPFIVLFVMILRNFAGDLRDVEKDTRDEMKTLPTMLGFKKNIRYGHLAMVLVSTAIWWHFAGLSIYMLAIVLAFEIGTYWITPR
ncbi:MAG: hypothetical protein WCO65_01250 [bacterium]